MKTTTWTLYVFVGFVALCHVGFSSPIVKRQVLDNPAYIDPAQQDLESQEENDRGKRLIEGGVELTYGVKNAVLGLFFNKLNAFIDHKTNWVNQLDQLNVAKNKQYHIEAPKDPITSFGNVFGSVLSNKLSSVGPIISLVTSKLGGSSGVSAGAGAGGGLLGSIGSLFGASSGGGAGGSIGALFSGSSGGAAGGSDEDKDSS